VVLLVEAIALGALGLPASFATLGMVASVIITVGLGLIAIYTSYVVGQVKLAYPAVSHYADAGRLLFEMTFGCGRAGYEIVGAMFVLQLIFLVGSHCLTGMIAFQALSENGACSLLFGFVSAVVLLLVALPPSFTEVAVLGYVDFASIILAIGITIISTGINNMRAVEKTTWSAWPKPGTTFTDAFVAVTNIVFAYSFAMCQFSFMDEMREPRDFQKSIWALGIIQIVLYTITGAVIFSFTGLDVNSPALLSAGELMSKIAFGVALPVIFISGSINGTVAGRYIHGRIFAGTVTRFINTPKGWSTWVAVISAVTVLAWIIAEAIPFFDDLLAISSSLFVSAFSFYLPAWMWFALIREGSWWSWRNMVLGIVNTAIFFVGVLVLIGGVYSSLVDIRKNYGTGDNVRKPFRCSPL
jgi:hypothetical protein